MVVVGDDVKGAKKGFHAVALRDGRYFDKYAADSAKAVPEWCREIRAQAIGIDAPSVQCQSGAACAQENHLPLQMSKPQLLSRWVRLSA
jgi:hypothetical protein